METKKILITIISIVLFSCSKNSEQINIAKNEAEKNVSETEKKGINYTCIEMSDREAYNEIMKYHETEYDDAQNTYDELAQKYNLGLASKYFAINWGHDNLGKYRIRSLEEMSTSELDSYLKQMNILNTFLDDVTKYQELKGKDLKELAKLKGESTYYKIIAVKKNPDTIFYKKVFLDNNNKIINFQNLK